VTYQAHMKAVADVGRHGRAELAMSDLRCCTRMHEAQPSGNAVDVGVDRKRRTTKREQQHTSSRFRAYAGQGTEIDLGVVVAEFVETIERGRTLARLDLAQDVLDTASLDIGNSPRADRIRHRGGGGIENRVPGGKALLEAGEGPPRIRVRCRLRQNREDQLVERGPARLGPELSVSLSEPAIERANAATRGF
jgi:hypothetical protein